MKLPSILNIKETRATSKMASESVEKTVIAGFITFKIEQRRHIATVGSETLGWWGPLASYVGVVASLRLKQRRLPRVA